jgi:paraquat-inducible protein B
MTVDPSVVTLLRDNTRIELHSPKLSLNDASLSSLLTGKTFELVPGEGEPRSQFVVIPGESRCYKIQGHDTYAHRAGKLRYRCRPAADSARRTGRSGSGAQAFREGVILVAIEPQHRDLVHGDSKFVVNSRVDVKVDLMAWSSSAPAPANGSAAGSAFCPVQRGNAKSYPLYANLEKAIENSLSDLPTTT